MAMIVGMKSATVQGPAFSAAMSSFRRAKPKPVMHSLGHRPKLAYVRKAEADPVDVAGSGCFPSGGFPPTGAVSPTPLLAAPNPVTIAAIGRIRHDFNGLEAIAGQRPGPMPFPPWRRQGFSGRVALAWGRSQRFVPGNPFLYGR
jgi:hypothetical protein